MKNGDFKSTFDTPKGTISLGKLEEAMQWVFYQKDFSYEDKLEKILNLENIAQVVVLDSFKFKINYIPYWSKKLKK